MADNIMPVLSKLVVTKSPLSQHDKQWLLIPLHYREPNNMDSWARMARGSGMTHLPRMSNSHPIHHWQVPYLMSSRDIFSLKCCLPAWRAMTLPEPVTWKRLAADCKENEAGRNEQFGGCPSYLVCTGFQTTVVR